MTDGWIEIVGTVLGPPLRSGALDEGNREDGDSEIVLVGRADGINDGSNDG